MWMSKRRRKETWTSLFTICVTPRAPCCLLKSAHPTRRSCRAAWEHCHAAERPCSTKPYARLQDYLLQAVLSTTPAALPGMLPGMLPEPLENFHSGLSGLLHPGTPRLSLARASRVPRPGPARPWQPWATGGTAGQEPLKLR